MAILVTQVQTDVGNHYPDIPQDTFLSLLNEVDNELQAKMRLVPQQLVQLSLTSGTGTYLLPDSASMIWEVAYIPSQGSYSRLEPTTFDYLDVDCKGWRGQSPGTPTYWYQDGGQIGLYPTPNTSTVGGFPILNVYCTEQPSLYLIGGSLPSIVHSQYAWVYGVCRKWAMMNHPDGFQGFDQLYKEAFSQLKAYLTGRNVRRKAKIRSRNPSVRIL